MTQPNLLELAKQGNVEAIASLFNRQLQPKGTTVKTTLSSGCLMVIAESDDVPDQAFLVDYIRKCISNLNCQLIKRVVVQGRMTGKNIAEWRESFDIEFAVTQNSKQATSISTYDIKTRINSAKLKLGIPKSEKLAYILSVIYDAR